MAFTLQWSDQKPTPWNLGKIVCIGRNYAEHAKELNNPIPATPLLFIKPATAAVDITQPLVLPQGQGECHHEAEIALLIGDTLSKVSPEEAIDKVVGVGLGLDLTLRDLQSTLKKNGHPWEVSKAFDGSAPLSAFVPCQLIGDKILHITLSVNDQLRQEGSSDQMITPLAELVSIISQTFTLEAGDVVLTGTPAGVAALKAGDHFAMSLKGRDQQNDCLAIKGCVAS
ncbi:fumarylacetoacetate hydrolase family protein [Oceanospirillum maris]|uniref:fumarylacetoacetate hydrolase family protein n=1 Tax=Oceanospirillum maris TaxID=64977 RepID=UPI0003F639AC|nr:fumarylacetoacetate hydrolase family protein [Oceanospirillum maris]